MAIRKRTFLIILFAGVLACTSLAGSARAGVPADAYEPNESVQAARAITTGTHALTIDRMGDIDYYNISITAGDTITIDITTDTNIAIQLSGPAGLITSAGAVSPNTGQLVHVATYTGNHTIIASNAVSCEYGLVISINAPATTPATPGYETTLVMAFSLAAIAAVYACIRSKLKTQE